MFCPHFSKVLLLVLLSGSLASARDIALVSNKANPSSAVTLPELVKLCKAQTGRWSDGTPVTFIMLTPSSNEMRMVLEKLYAMNERDVDGLIVSSGHAHPSHPAIVIAASDEELVNKVASTPGAVGVVDVYSINSSVSVMRVAGKLPLEPGYLLHGN